MREHLEKLLEATRVALNSFLSTVCNFFILLLIINSDVKIWFKEDDPLVSGSWVDILRSTLTIIEKLNSPNQFNIYSNFFFYLLNGFLTL